MHDKIREPEFLSRAKQSYITRRVPRAIIQTLLKEASTPAPGDLVLARVQWLGQIDTIEDHRGHPTPIRQDDLLILAYGNYQDLDQYDAVLPDSLSLSDLTTTGGLISSVKCWHHALSYPTRLEPLGLLADERGQRLNLLRFGLQGDPGQCQAATYAMVGARANILQDAVRSLLKHQQRVGVLKITGSCCAQHRETLRQHGAEWVVDFSDAGYASTYLLPSHELLGIFVSLTHHLNRQGATAILVEVAGPLKQRESRLLITSPLFRANVDGMLIAGEDGCCPLWESDTERAEPLPLSRTAVRGSGRLASPTVGTEKSIGLSVSGEAAIP